MSKKRPRRAPDVTKGPKPVQASRLPQKPPPRRGKSGSPLRTGDAAREAAKVGAATTGTSQSGKPMKPALDPATLASTDASRKKGSAAQIAEPPVKPRKLSAREIEERKNRFNSAYGRKRMLEREKKNVTADMSRAIKKLGKECDDLHAEITRGTELLRQGELPLYDSELQAGAATPTPGQAGAALAEIAKHVEGNGKPKNGEATEAPIPGSVTVVETPKPESDLDRAARLEAAGAPA